MKNNSVKSIGEKTLPGHITGILNRFSELKNENFDINKIKILENSYVYDPNTKVQNYRKVLKIELPDPSKETVLIYRSSGTSTPDLEHKSEGNWQIFGGWSRGGYKTNENKITHGKSWYIKTDETVNFRDKNDYVKGLLEYFENMEKKSPAN